MTTIITRRIPFTLLIGFATSAVLAQYPEPEVCIYGTITINGAAMTAANTNLRVEVRRPDNALVIDHYTMGDDTRVGDFYRVFVPVTTESTSPSPETMFIGDSVEIVLLSPSELVQETVLLTDVGAVLRQDLDFTGTLDMAQAGDDQVVCGNSTIISGNTPVFGTGQWQIVSGVGGQIANPYQPTTTFTGTPDIGTYVLQWSITNPSLDVTTDEIQITFISQVEAEAGPGFETCATSVTLQASAEYPGYWTIEQGSSGVLTDLTQPDTQFSGIPGEFYRLRWNVDLNTCDPSFDETTVAFGEAANAGPNLQTCTGSVTLQATAPVSANGHWAALSGDGHGWFVDDTHPQSTFFGTQGVNYLLQWTLDSGFCSTSDTTQVSIAVYTTDAGLDQYVCGPSTTLTAATNHPGSWTILSGVGGQLQDPNVPNTVFSGQYGGSYVLRWALTNTACGLVSDEVVITFMDDAFAGPNLTSCETSVQLQATPPQTTTGQWAILSGEGGWFADASDPNTTFFGTQGVDYQLSWTLLGDCSTSDTTQVRLLVNSTEAGPDQDICGPSTTLAASSKYPGTWSVQSGSGAQLQDPGDPHTVFTGLSGQTYVLRWSLVDTTCGVVSDDVIIAFKERAKAGPDLMSCDTSVQLQAIPPTGDSTGTWTVESGTGGSFVDAEDPQTQFMGEQGQDYTLTWTLVNGDCTSSDTTSVRLMDSTTDAGTDQEVCGTSTTLSASSEDFGTWSIQSGSGGQLQDPGDPNTAFSGLPAKTYVLRWSLEETTCGLISDDVNITFLEQAKAGPDLMSCDTSVPLQATAPDDGGVGTWSVASGIGGSFVDAEDPNTLFWGEQGEDYVLTWTLVNGDCTSSDNTSVRLMDSTTDAGTDQEVCGASTILTASPDYAGTWTILSGSGGRLQNATQPEALFSGKSGETYSLRWTLTETTCGLIFDDVNITFLEHADAGPNVMSCEASTELQATPPSDGDGHWSILSGYGGEFVDAADPRTTFYGVQGVDYELQWTLTTPDCTTVDTTTVQFNTFTAEIVPFIPISCDIGLSFSLLGRPICGTEPYTYAWSLVDATVGADGIFSDPHKPSTTFTPDSFGNYLIQLEILDIYGSVDVDDFHLTVPLVEADGIPGFSMGDFYVRLPAWLDVDDLNFDVDESGAVDIRDLLIPLHCISQEARKTVTEDGKPEDIDPSWTAWPTDADAAEPDHAVNILDLVIIMRH